MAGAGALDILLINLNNCPVGIFSNKSSVPLSQWMLFGITKLNETKFATIQQYDEQNVLDHVTKSNIDSTISNTKTIFFLLNVSLHRPERKHNVDIDPVIVVRTTTNVLKYYYAQQGMSESDSAKKTEEVMDEVTSYLQYFKQNNPKKISDITYCFCKKFADGIYPPKINVNGMNSTIDEGYKNVIIMKYAEFVFEAIETSLLNSLKKFKIVPG